MARIIFKCPYLKGGAKSASHLNNYVRYMATREGAQHLAPDLAQCPVTEPQKQLVERLLRDFPLSRGLFEYEDYVAAPTQGNASEFITRALEDNADQISKRVNYVDYMVDHAGCLLAVYDNDRSIRSGTGMTVNYARKKGLPITLIHPDKATISKEKPER